MPTVIPLRERGRHLLRLDPLDLAFLRGLPRNWVRVERIAGTRRRLVRVGGIAGTLVAPTCQFSIAPKVRLGSLLGLLDLENPPTTLCLSDGAAPTGKLLDLLARAFVFHVRERLRAGLQRGYREQTLAAPVLQGRLDLPAQIRHGPTRPEVLHQTVDAYSPDIPCNRLIRAALAGLIGSEGLAPETRAECHRICEAFAEVQPLEPRAWQTPLTAPAEYAATLDVARLLLAGLAGERTGERSGGPGAGFIVELERLFENYVQRGLQRVASPGTVVEPQARRIFRGHGGPALVVQPDALVLADGEPSQVIDAKWKRLRRGRPSRADLYQAVAYADVLGVPEAVLVYPGPRDRCRHYPRTRRGTRVTIWTLHVEHSTQAFRRILTSNGRFD